MKKLYIIRHAKSSWKDLTLNDFDRPLNKRGKQNVLLMGSILKEKHILPDMIISSPALRAKLTAKEIARIISFTKDIKFYENIYDASSYDLIGILKSIDDNNNSLFLFGHNPSLNSLAETFIGLYENIPTCAIVEIEFDCNKWKDIDQTNANLVSFDYPKRYN